MSENPNDRKPLYSLTDEELHAVCAGDRDEEYGEDAHRARSTARTILVNRSLQLTHPQAFTR